MKDERHTIDDLFKDRLYDVESDVQPTSWDNISKKIQPKSAFSGKKWFYGLGGAGTLIVAAYVMYVNNNTDIPVSKNVQPEVKAAVVASDSVTNIQKEVYTSTKSAETKKTAQTVSLTKLVASDERKTVQLPDGSEVILNRNSSISYSTQFIKDRKVYISGEVYVHSAAGQKLIVISNLAQIEAVESAFIVKSDKSQTYDEIFVSKGKVDCAHLLANENRIVIFAGNNAVINKGGDVKQQAIRDINYNDWVTEKIVFNNTALNSVFETLEKYYNVSLKADNPEIMNCHFTGTFERNNINEILQVLSVSFNLSFNQNSEEYILSGKGCK